MMPGESERRAPELESRWRQALETAPEVYLALDGEGTVVDGNRSAAGLFDLAKEQLVGAPVRRFVPDASWPTLAAALAEATGDSDRQLSEPLQLVLRDGSGREFAGEFLAWGVDRRGSIRLHCFVRDVTERQRAQRQASLLAAVVDGSGDAIVTESPTGEILSWNPAAERVYGWTPAEAVGAPSSLAIPPEKVAEHESLVAAVLRGERVPSVDTERLSKGGVRIPVALRLSPVHDTSGAVVAVSTVARDLTEQRWMAETLDDTLEQLQVALDEARASEESSRRFLADAAHQLRTPLSGIRACAELLLLGAQDADRDRLLATMVRETSRSARLITALLTIARLDQGQPLPVGEVDLVAMCADEVERLSLLAPELAVTLDLRQAPAGPLALDGGSCREILSNLGDNARRFARTAITFIVERVDGQVCVRVRDDGPGVSADVQERVFERFVSLDGRGGAGLGLPIARSLARAMGGELAYDSGFLLTLPATAADPSG